jgi:hypothetical protein
MAGMTYLTRNVLLTVRNCMAIGCVLFGLFAWERKIGGQNWTIPIAAGALAVGLYLGGLSTFVLHGSVFFFVAVVLLAALSSLAIRRRDDFPKHHHLACWALFSVCLLSKLVFRPTLFYYGFALTMPIVVLAIALAIDWLPKVISRDGVGVRFRSGLIALLVFDASLILAHTAFFTSDKKHELGSGTDCIRCHEKQGVPLQLAADYLSDRMAPDDTLLVLPEGISLNYLLRRENNSPYVNFMQPELVMFGEKNILAEFQRNPSDYVLLVTRPLKSYRLRHFGQPGYGDQIMKWIRANYILAEQFGSNPLVMDEFGVQVLRRRAAESTAATARDSYASAR